MNLQGLKKQMPFQWVITSISKDEKKACLCAYIDARDVMNLLDEVVGAENWQDKYYHQGVNTYCEIGIKIGNEWVWKSDTGSIGSMNIEPEKSLASDSFKRSAVKWGVGRFLYSIAPIWLNYDKSSKRVYDNVNFSATQYEKEKINKYCNDMYNNKNNNKVKTTPTALNTVQVNEDIKTNDINNDRLAELKGMISKCYSLKDIKNLNEQYGKNITALGLTNELEDQKKKAWQNWFNQFTKDLEACENAQDIEQVQTKHKFLIESKDYKGLCEKLIKEIKVNLKV